MSTMPPMQHGRFFRYRGGFCLSVLLSVILLLSGCTAMSVVSISAAAVNLGTMAYRSLEAADISIAMDPEADRDAWNTIDRIALWMGRESMTSPYGRIGDLGAVVADNLVMELMQRGYTVYGSDRISMAVESPPLLAESERDKLLAAVRDLNVQVVLTGHVSAGQVGSLGFAGSVRTSTVVQSFSLKMTEATSGRTMMILTIDYHAGQPPRVAAAGAAAIVKAKLDDPGADIRKLFGYFRNGGGVKDSPEDREI